jgi:hypothetical protein
MGDLHDELLFARSKWQRANGYRKPPGLIPTWLVDAVKPIAIGASYDCHLQRKERTVTQSINHQARDIARCLLQHLPEEIIANGPDKNAEQNLKKIRKSFRLWLTSETIMQTIRKARDEGFNAGIN